MALTSGLAAAGTLRPPKGGREFPLLELLAGLAALAAALPLIGVLLAAFSGPGADIPLRDVARYAVTSAWLALLVGLITAVAGSLAAWLVVMHRFPGRSFFAWALALPLAAPAFALAYAYADLFDVASGLRMWMRASLGVDLPFEMRSILGAAFVLGCAFYPYVYLAMRAAFLNQSVAVLEAARTLGCTQRQAFVRAAMPLARPALAAGAALAVMETLADYGAVQFLAVQTLTTGVVRAWSVYGSTAGAAQFALPLLGAAALLLWIERRGRRGKSFDAANAKWRPLPVTDLAGWKAAGASLFCLFLLTAGLLLPVGWLFWTSLSITPELPRLVRAGIHSLGLGVGGAAVTVTLAAALALGARRIPAAARLASLGYATPGAVMAIGLLAPAAIIWRMSPNASGFGIGIALLIYAYAARLMAAALEPIDAGLAKVTPSMIWASRSLGRSAGGAAWSVQLPVARGSLLTAALVVFIDVLKELPATLILRPFNFDTLAVIANNYALDERLGQAGWPSLGIILISLPAVMFLSRKIALSRPGT
ncbi:MAG: ABC transporter permease [Allosphingosinicella sp.]|uniref:ABC transporter permease n=1 Tax=Allosphingosinicella sp. TaxID=2823234 RepID=UPI0039346A1A